MAELQQAGGTAPAPVPAPAEGCQAPPLPRRKVLLCAVPAARDSLLPVWEALKPVNDVGWLTVRGCSRVAPIEVPLPGVSWIDPPASWEELVNSVEAVVLTGLPLEVLSKMALLIPDVPAVAAALTGLIQGRPVFAASPEVDKFRRSSGRLAGGLQAAYYQHLRAVEGLGLQILEPPQLAQKLQSGVARSLPSSAKGRDVLTVEDLDAALRSGQRVLNLAPGTIVTPLAQEKAQTMGIEVRFA